MKESPWRGIGRLLGGCSSSREQTTEPEAGGDGGDTEEHTGEGVEQGQAAGAGGEQPCRVVAEGGKSGEAAKQSGQEEEAAVVSESGQSAGSADDGAEGEAAEDIDEQDAEWEAGGRGGPERASGCIQTVAGHGAEAAAQGDKSQSAQGTIHAGRIP